MTKVINKRILNLILLFSLFACKDLKKEKSAPDLPERQFDKVKLTDLKNISINLKQYGRKTIFLNFWATWCKPCLEEMPSIENAQKILKNENIIFLMASGESAEEIEGFRKTHGYNFNYLRIENSEELGIQVLPTTFIFNPEGELVFSEIGYRKWDEENNINLIRKNLK